MNETRNWTIPIVGMTCDRCAHSIDDALGKVSGVERSSTSFEAGSAGVTLRSEASLEQVHAAIERLGFTVVRGARLESNNAHRGGQPVEDRCDDFDLLIVGGGSAAFAAAIRASELGKTAAIVERGILGGTCVNFGCVPSKTLIRAAEAHHRASHHGFDGVRATTCPIDLRAVVAQKRALVAELQRAKYWDVLAAYPNIELIRGAARLDDEGRVWVDGKHVPARNVLVATGSRPAVPRIPGLVDAGYLTSTEAMELEDLPRRLVVLGGGYVGLELGQTFARFGSKVTVVARSRLLRREEPSISDALADYLRGEGLDVLTNTMVREVRKVGGEVHLVVSNEAGTQTLLADDILVATGRVANTDELGLADASIETRPDGSVAVDERLQTTRPGVFAAGDVTGEPAFVYVAAYAGRLAASQALSAADAPAYDTTVVPRVTFTDPQVASVGLTEAEARSQGIGFVATTLPMTHVPRAIAARDTRGHIKLLADKNTRKLVGAHILAPEAGDLIEQAVMAIRFGIDIDQLASLMYPYLTNAEAIKLACQTFDKDVAKLSCCAA
jgi:mercuric reductase